MTITPEAANVALKSKCGLCKAEPAQPCINPCTGEPLTDRPCHHYRINPETEKTA